jgi:hypothetical protein
VRGYLQANVREVFRWRAGSVQPKDREDNRAAKSSEQQQGGVSE